MFACGVQQELTPYLNILINLRFDLTSNICITVSKMATHVHRELEC